MNLSITHPFSGNQLKLEEIEKEVKGKAKSNVDTANFKKCPFCHDPVFLNWSFCWNWACQGGVVDQKTERDRNIKKLWKDLNLHSPSFENLAFNSAEFNFDGKKKRLKKMTFRNCTFIGTHFSNIVFDHCTFEHVNFTGATFRKCSFKNVRFKNCDIFYAKFEQTDFRGSLLFGLALLSSLLRCHFKKVEVKDVDFEKCSLKGKFGQGCKISKTIFSNCNLRDCDFSLASTDNTVVITRTVSKKEEAVKEEDIKLDLVAVEEKSAKIKGLPSSPSPKKNVGLYITHPFSGSQLKLEEIEEVREKTKSNVGTANFKKCPHCDAPVFFNWSSCWQYGTKKPDTAHNVRTLWEDLRAYSFRSIENRSFNYAEFNFEGKKRRLKETTFRNCTFIGTHFSNIIFDYCAFENVNFTGATFRNCSFKGVIFKNCDIFYATFKQTDFGNSLLSGIALFSSSFKCHFKKVEFKDVDFKKCFLNTKFDKECKISRTTFSNCNMYDCDLSPANTDNTVIITGEDTKIEGLSLNVSQRKDTLTLDFHADHYKIIKIKFSSLQNYRLKNIRYGVTDKIALIFDCMVIASLISLVSYTIWSFFDNNASLEPFFRIAAYAFVVILSLGFYSSYRITKNDLKYLEQIRPPQEQPSQSKKEGFWGKFEKAPNTILNDLG